MESYGFFTGDGNELNRGYQCTEEQARRQCQRYADMTGQVVECVVEPCAYDYANDCPAEPICVCEPKD